MLTHMRATSIGSARTLLASAGTGGQLFLALALTTIAHDGTHEIHGSHSRNRCDNHEHGSCDIEHIHAGTVLSHPRHLPAKDSRFAYM